MKVSPVKPVAVPSAGTFPGPRNKGLLLMIIKEKLVGAKNQRLSFSNTMKEVERRESSPHFLTSHLVTTTPALLLYTEQPDKALYYITVRAITR